MGREEEAKDFLVRYHGNGDPSSVIVEIEWAEFKEVSLDHKCCA